MTEEQQNQFFEHWEDDRFYQDQGIYRLALDLTSGLVKGDVLDLGCGSRVYYDTSSVQNWTGVDLAPRLLENLQFLSGQAPSGELQTLQASCLDLDLPDESFDTVCSIFLLHHLARKNRRRSLQRIEQLLSNAYRVLKLGGSMVVFESWPHVLLHLYNLSYPALYPIVQKASGTELPYFFSARTLAKIAAQIGFRRRHILAVPLYETAKYPIGGFVVPGGIQPLIHKYGVYVFVK